MDSYYGKTDRSLTIAILVIVAIQLLFMLILAVIMKRRSHEPKQAQYDFSRQQTDDPYQIGKVLGFRARCACARVSPAVTCVHVAESLIERVFHVLPHLQGDFSRDFSRGYSGAPRQSSVPPQRPSTINV